MDTNSKQPEFSGKFGIKLLIVAIITILLLIPVSQIREIISDRAERSRGAISEIAQKWGPSQTLGLVFLEVPVTGPTDSVLPLSILPEKFEIIGEVESELRNRGIFRTNLYKGDFVIRGSFRKPDLGNAFQQRTIHWAKARVILGLDDPNSIRKLTTSIAGKEQKYISETNPGSGVELGVSVNSTDLGELGNDKEVTFEVKISLAGTETLNILPIAKESTITLKSNWTNPSFGGTLLPEKRNISEAGFEATWKNLRVVSAVSGFWRGNDLNLRRAPLGSISVGFVSPVNIYQQSERSVKYALLFILLSFCILLTLEIVIKGRLHPAHYTLVGAALVLFYLLLLSLSEHLSFLISYLIAGSATTILTTLYIKSLLPKGKTILAYTAYTIFSYAFFYFLLQEESYSLLFGSLGLFIILSAIMYTTRSTNWSVLTSTPSPKDQCNTDASIPSFGKLNSD